MPMSRTQSIIRSATALIVLATITIGVPAILIAIAHWPLPTSVPALGDVWTRLQQGDIPSATVVKALAVVVWLIWLQLTWALVWEVGVNLRRIGDRQPPKPAPLVPAAVGHGMSRLVAMIFSATVIVASFPAPSLAAPGPVAVPTEVSSATPSDADRASEPVTLAAESCWLVHPADSLWRIAETALGDGSRSNEILDLNAHLQSARDVAAGQRLRLPADATIPADRQPAVETPRAALVLSYIAETSVSIEPGDTLWDLSTERLEAFNAAAPSPAEVVDYVNRVVDRNPEVVEDPNLIYPGEVFVMPQLGTALPPAAEQVEQPPIQPSESFPPPEAAEQLTEEPPPASAEATVDPVGGSDQVAPDADIGVGSPSPGAVSSTDRVPVDASPAAPGPGASTSTDTSDIGAPWMVGVGGSTVLASGLLLLLRRRRRAAAVRGERTHQADPDHALVDQLVRASDVPILQWARHELAALFADPDLPPTAGVPVAVEISHDTGIEMLWSEPNTAAPRPWEAADGGWEWRATYDPNIEMPSNPLPTPLPGLVSVGQREGRQLLLNLESFGVLDITGDPDVAEDLLRSMVAELATDEILADTYVHLVETDLGDLPDTARLLRRSRDDAGDIASHVVEEHEALLDAASADFTLELRRGDEAAGREMTVLVVDDHEQVAVMRDLVPPHRGIALLTLGETGGGGASIEVDVDGSARLLPLELNFKAAQLPATAASVIAELVAPTDSITEPDIDDLKSTELDDLTWAVDDDMQENVSELVGVFVGKGHGDCLDAPSPPEVMVTVFGAPRVDDFPELGRMDTNLVAFLACNGGEATEDQLIDAVWNGRMVERSTVWNRISKARSVLGPHLPAREQGTARVQLATTLGTDLDYFAKLVSYADDGSSDEAIGLLVEALELVEGQPFDAAGYDWAHQQQHHARACELIESTAIRLVDLALDAGKVDVGRRGVSQALRALPGNEPVYRSRMRLEAAADNSSGVCVAFDELTSVLAELSEAGFEFEPSGRTIRLRDELLRLPTANSA
jgi:LPXTG-motif cell wall-anchored protein